ncbi:MAG: signal recognition particle-docking protein FtsY [Coriobacteriia bacterium]
MSTPWYRKFAEGLSRTREQLGGSINVLLRRGPELDDSFWEDLEDVLIASDMGVTATTEIVDALKRDSTRRALETSDDVLDLLVEHIAEAMESGRPDPLEERPLTLLVVGVNGTGKTTTVGKIAHEMARAGRRVIVGSADTFRAAAIEQLDVWAQRAGVPVVKRERGSDPAAVAYETLSAAKRDGHDTVIIDTAGRLHTSRALMDELDKVARITKRESPHPVRTMLVMDATTGQNGFVQARAFDEALDVDCVALTKLDGTAKGGVTVAIVRELGMPVVRVGFGEGLEDLKPFDAKDFAEALVRG